MEVEMFLTRSLEKQLKMNKKKHFDCVEIMHYAATKIHKELQGKTIEERLEYWNRQYKRQKEKQLQKLGTNKDD